MKARVALTGILIVFACGEQPFHLAFNVRTDSVVVAHEGSDDTPSWYVCHVTLALHAKGGHVGEVAVFQGGEYEIKQSDNEEAAQSRTITAADFLQEFGADGVLYGDNRQAKLWFMNRSPEPYELTFGMRFRMPDGSLVSMNDAVVCSEG
jgi:hypothetical protein